MSEHNIFFCGTPFWLCRFSLNFWVDVSKRNYQTEMHDVIKIHS